MRLQRFLVNPVEFNDEICTFPYFTFTPDLSIHGFNVFFNN